MFASRAAWIAEHGDIPDELHVLHHCDDGDCTRLDHLYLGTPGDNVRDREIRGRHHTEGYLTEEDHPNARFTDEDVQEMRHLRSTGMRQVDIAARYDCSEGYLSLLLNNNRRLQ
jgi:hypothetical protein